ncbi:MAG: phosphotransferase family protein [Deltaproteobacteria bacterium]|nr:phosphotransferase family protein [Deltaproteobacteria bacterium]
MKITDDAKAVRQGEELDTVRLEGFLRDAVADLPGELVLRQFPGGNSNLTYLIRFGERDLILRRPPFGRKAKGSHDMGREYRVLDALYPVFPYCPRPIVYTEDASVIGCPFFVMERVRGLVIRRELPPGLAITEAQGRKLCENLAELQAALHAIDYKAVGLEGFGRPEGYVKRQVEGWIERFRQARTLDAPDCEKVMEWLAANRPADSGRASVIHNDFKLDNVVVDEQDPTRIVAVLDWEMATIGDPLMDFGNILSYRVERGDPPEMDFIRFMPPEIEFCLTRKELADVYAAKSGRTMEDMNYFYCFGLFRLAAIDLQIYYRYYHGQTSDKRFAGMIEKVRVLEKTALRAIEEA